LAYWPAEGEAPQPPDELPACIYDMLEAHTLIHGGKGYPDRAAALAALSDSCLVWARLPDCPGCGGEGEIRNRPDRVDVGPLRVENWATGASCEACGGHGRAAPSMTAE